MVAFIFPLVFATSSQHFVRCDLLPTHTLTSKHAGVQKHFLYTQVHIEWNFIQRIFQFVSMHIYYFFLCVYTPQHVWLKTIDKENIYFFFFVVGYKWSYLDPVKVNIVQTFSDNVLKCPSGLLSRVIFQIFKTRCSPFILTFFFIFLVYFASFRTTSNSFF